MPRRKGSLLTLPVAWGNLSVGDKSCRIGVTVDRSSLKVAEADKHLCEKRLTGQLQVKAPDEHPDQQHLDGMENGREVAGSFDIKGFSVSKDAITFGLTFAIASVNVESLAHFAKRAGTLLVDDSEAIPENGDDEEEEEDENLSVVEKGRRHLEGK